MLEEQKEHYDTAKELISVIKVLMQPEDIVEQYLAAADEMKLAGDYEDAKKLEKKYRQQAVTAEAEGKEKLYLEAKNRMEKAEKDVELILARMTFERIKGYRDADHLSEECNKMIEVFGKRQKKKQWIVTFLIIVAAITLVFGVVRTDHEKEMKDKKKEVSKVIDTDDETDLKLENI